MADGTSEKYINPYTDFGFKKQIAQGADMDVEEVKKTALAIAAQFGVGIAIDFAEAMGVSRSEAESWFADPQVG